MLSELTNNSTSSEISAVAQVSPKPKTRAVRLECIPEALLGQRSWVLWKWVFKGGKWTKVPFQCSGSPAKSNDAATWNTLDEVQRVLKSGDYDGIGCMLSPGLGVQVIDLDNCFDKADQLKPWARETVDQYARENAFVEYSPTEGKGLHIWLLGSQEKVTSHQRAVPGDPDNAKVEMFNGASPRYVTFTGWLFPGSSSQLGKAPNATEWLKDKYQIGKRARRSGQGKLEIDGESAFETAALRAEANAQQEDRLRSAARFLKPTRENWIRYGMGLKAGSFRFEFFHELSKGWPDYLSEDDCRTHWDGFDPRGDISIGSIFHDATEAGWQGGVVRGVPSQVPSYWSVPAKYVLDQKGLGVWVQNSSKPTYLDEICGPIAVVATTIGLSAGSGGLMVELLSCDEKLHRIPVPRARLHQDARRLAEEFAALNFKIKPGREQKLLEFLHACEPNKRLFASGLTGWVEPSGEHNKLIYVCHAFSTDDDYVFQPEATSVVSKVTKCGSLIDWQREVFSHILRNPFAIYEVFKSLAACLLKFYSAETSEHLHGRTTSGKTTLMQIGASVWGCGADPSSTRDSYINRWNATSNGLEGCLSEFNHLPVYLDEIGSYQGSDEDFRTLVYNASSGAGKTAMNANRVLKPSRKWLNTITSTGEVAIREMLERPIKGQSATAKGGQMLRFIDRHIPDKTFAGAKEVDSLKNSCSRYYGTLGEAFVRRLASEHSLQSLTTEVEGICRDSLSRLESAHPRMTTVERRALKRFALAEAAGLLAVRFELLPGLSILQVSKVVDYIVAQWAENSSEMNDDERMQEALREFIKASRDLRFRIREGSPLGPGDSSSYDLGRTSRETAGVIDSRKGIIYIFPRALAEATGLTHKEAAKALQRLGILVREEKDRATSRVTLGNAKVSAYAVRESFLGERDPLSLEDLL